MMQPVPSDRLRGHERLALACFFVVVVLFGGLVELRTTFLQRRMGDLNCFLRPAWAIRAGQDIYQLVDDCGWHYNYPPFLAIVLTPLADAPAGADRTGMLPYSVSVALWYVLSLLCLALGVHWLAGALEECSGNPHLRPGQTGTRSWWALRLLPVLACLVPIGHTLMRGQCNLLVLMCFCAMMAALLRRQSLRAGCWLAWPICIKVYPAFLLLYPLWRRDWRFLGGCGLGLLVGLVLIPVAALGPTRTVSYYREYFQVTLAPGLGLGEDLSRAGELTHITSTDSQSLLAALHNTLHPDPATRPEDASPGLRKISYLLGGLLTMITLWTAGWRRSLAPPDLLLFAGALILTMLLLCPVCHLHYFCLALPLVMGMLASTWERRPAPQLDRGLIALLLANTVILVLPNLPALRALRDLSFAVYSGLLLWGAAIVLLWNRSQKPAPLGLVSTVKRPAA